MEKPNRERKGDIKYNISLNEEQKEAEGWGYVTQMTSSDEFRVPFEEVYMKEFEYGYYQLHYSNTHFASLSVWNCKDKMKPIQSTLYKGQITSINEFRYITNKLLNIN